MSREGTGVADAVLLEDASLGPFVDNLEKRFEAGEVYTSIGSVVISMNPYRQIPELYAAPHEYFGTNSRAKPPHVYKLASAAFSGMMATGKSQAIVVSGESGAGKTEASKIVMRYIAAVSGSRAESVDSIKDALLSSNPILEAFGNAQTLRNDNSSRFGKYMEIQFDERGVARGGLISQYLLEKSRVVRPARGERSFHAFYFVLAGADADTKAALGLDVDPGSFPYLAHSGTYAVPSIDDAAEFETLVTAMRTLEFPAETQATLFRILAAILHLSRVQFEPGPRAKSPTSQVVDAAAVATVAELLQVDATTLARALTSHTIETRGETINIPMGPDEATYTRDSFASALYDAMFAHIVACINNSISAVTAVSSSIGVLDIYGFEILASNTFEQFCINYTNEKLQKLFIDLTLHEEQAEYEAEGIEWVPVDYFDNGVICALIDGKAGIFHVLDEDTVLPKTTDESFLAKLVGTRAGSSPHFSCAATNRALKLGPTEFVVDHYAGSVTYTATSFLEKNKTKTYPDFAAVLQASGDAVVASLAPALALGAAATATSASGPGAGAKAGAGAGAGAGTTKARGPVRKRATTTVSVFKRQLASLLTTLQSSVPHYIRCIKPNDVKSSSEFDVARVSHQVQYLGLLEHVRVARAGFCFREPFPSFVGRFKMLASATWPTPSADEAAAVTAIMDAQGIEPSAYQLGTTKVFIKNPATVFALEDARAAALPSLVTVIQSVWRSVQTRRRLAREAAVTRIATAWRRFVVRRAYLETRSAKIIARAWRRFTLFRWVDSSLAAKKIQRAWKSGRAREAFRQAQSAILLQSYIRGAAARSSFRVVRASSTIGSVQKGRYVRTHFEEIKAQAIEEKRLYKLEWAATRVQAWVRGAKERRQLALHHAALRIQASYRGHKRREAYLRARAEDLIRRFILRVVLERRLEKMMAVSHIAARWRGHKARVAFRRLIAARKIQRWLRKVWASQWLGAVERTIESEHPRQWPDPVVETDGAMQAAELMLQTYLAWWAREYRNGLSETRRIEMWRKVRASNMFRTAKPSAYAPSVGVAFKGDQLGLGDKAAPPSKNFVKAATAAGDDPGSVVFSAPISKVNRSFKIDSNSVALTRKNLYRLKGGKVKSLTPLDAIVSATCSPYADHYIVLCFEENVGHHDMVFACADVIEFATRLMMLLDAVHAKAQGAGSSTTVIPSGLPGESGGPEATVEFGTDIPFREPKGQYRLVFTKDAAVAEPTLSRVKGDKTAGRVTTRA